MAYGLLVMALLLNGSANLLLKIGASRLRGATDAGYLAQFIGNTPLLGGLLLFVLNVVCYVAALNRLELSIAYPVMVAGSLLVVVLCSALWLGEALTLVQWSGIALLLVGIVLVASRPAA